MSRMAANQEIENSYFVDTNKQGLDQLLAPDNSWLRIRFVAKVSTALPPVPLASVSGNPVRWTYTLIRQTFNATASQHEATVDDTDSLTVTAYNVAEWYNATGIFGDGTNIANLPVGTYLVPISGIVFVNSYRTKNVLGNTDIVYLFERNNGYECPEGQLAPPEEEGEE